MNKSQVKIETFKKINGEIQIDYNGAYVGSLRPSPPWFKEDGIDTESIANLIASAPETLKALKEIEKFAQEEFPTESSLLKHSSPSYDPVAGMKYALLQRILIITHKAIAKAEVKS